MKGIWGDNYPVSSYQKPIHILLFCRSIRGEGAALSVGAKASVITGDIYTKVEQRLKTGPFDSSREPGQNNKANDDWNYR